MASAAAAVFTQIGTVRPVSSLLNGYSGRQEQRSSLVRSWSREHRCCCTGLHLATVPWIGSSGALRSSTRFGALPDAEVSQDVEVKEAVGAATVAVIAPDAADEGAAKAAAAALETAEGEPVARPVISKDLQSIYDSCRQWTWRGFRINYAVQGSGPPLLLVHGFGASIGHWRKNIPVLARKHEVYAIDLLGLGSSDKPADFVYTMEIWSSLVVDFVREVIHSPAVVVGNSIGSLACLMATVEAPSLVRGTVLLNCAGGMNNKAVTEDWRLKLASPILWLLDLLLKQPWLASRLFHRVKSRDNIKSVLQSVYSFKDAVDEELVEVILRPADDPGALNTFVSIITGDPGPKPQTLMPRIAGPVLLLWGDQDPFTPIDGPVGKYFSQLAQTAPNVELHLLPDVGHCPHDDRPELVHDKLLPWLAAL